MGTLRINEIFYSLQGEGRRVGEPSIFIRTSGCSMAKACASYGVSCDTEFVSGRDYTEAELLAECQRLALQCQWVVWTGGEPTDQLTGTAVELFKAAGYKQAIETSGVRSVPPGLDWITVSPKVAEHMLPARFLGQRVNELKYVRRSGQSIPEPALTADHYYLQPHANGATVDSAALANCMSLCLQHPQWALSLQTHKTLGIR